MDNTIKNIPSKIYLNISDILTFEKEIDFKDLSEVTWCKDKINDNDIEYTLRTGEDGLREELVRFMKYCNLTYSDERIKSFINTYLKSETYSNKWG